MPRSTVTEMIDLHNHVIPGVDDGARDPAEGVAAVMALADEGVTRVVATPHFDASLTLEPPACERRLAEIDAGMDRLTDALAAATTAAPMLGLGVELKLDVPEFDLSDPRLRLEGGTAVLVEFPHMMVPPRSTEVLREVRRAGHVPLLAHPERYYGIDRSLTVVEEWLQAEALLQVNAGSLLGRYGEQARRIAEALLARGWVHCMSSDYHSRGDLYLRRTRKLLEDRGAFEQVRLLFETNGDRLIRGEACLPVPPLRTEPSFWSRLFRRRRA